MPFDRETTYNKIVSIIADQLSVAKQDIEPKSSLEELGADSLDRVEIIMRLEEEFGIEINDEEAEKMTTIDQAVDYIYKLQSQKQDQ